MEPKTRGKLLDMKNFISGSTIKIAIVKIQKRAKTLFTIASYVAKNKLFENNMH